ncbi:MAG: hypothetical protein EZS28_054371 [Streblomastix strix]|uniref:Uncharacterized protein n=1 Tax=Streblomastix strix TaxID=222440 RepID=A0A5J4QM56_9EUKA|nr:MAG: hypothetical protein EZS28_054371 [Streblomastix strix]
MIVESTENYYNEQIVGNLRTPEDMNGLFNDETKQYYEIDPPLYSKHQKYSFDNHKPISAVFGFTLISKAPAT